LACLAEAAQRRRQEVRVTSHAGLMIIFALFVSIVFGTLMRDEPKEQLRFGARLFAAFAVGGIALGWLLYPLPL
jgi:undecaprenyl pyrophosphate phosphatase UppP